MTNILKARRIAVLALPLIALASLTGCQPIDDGTDSGVEGVLWRQIASFEDPLSIEMFGSARQEDYLATLPAKTWDGSPASVADLGLPKGGAVIYDIESHSSQIQYSVFIASGPRAAGLTDDGEQYYGPDTVYTCYGIGADFDSGKSAQVDRRLFTECPAELVDELPDDALFASGEEFDG